LLSPRLDFRVVFEFDGQRIGAVSDNKRDARSPFLHEDKLRFKFHPAAREGSIGIRDLPSVVAETPDPYVQGNYWTAIGDKLDMSMEMCAHCAPVVGGRGDRKHFS
jgi:alpha-mannosidase